MKHVWGIQCYKDVKCLICCVKKHISCFKQLVDSQGDPHNCSQTFKVSVCVCVFGWRFFKSSRLKKGVKNGKYWACVLFSCQMNELQNLSWHIFFLDNKNKVPDACLQISLVESMPKRTSTTTSTDFRCGYFDQPGLQSLNDCKFVFWV